MKINIYTAIIPILFTLLCSCNNTSESTSSEGNSYESTTNAAKVNVESSGDCINYLRGKSFYGGSIRLDFMLDGNVGVYNSQTNELVFTGYLEIGEKYGAANRKLKVRDTYNSSQVVKLMLGEDGKLMDESDFTIYKTN